SCMRSTNSCFWICGSVGPARKQWCSSWCCCCSPARSFCSFAARKARETRRFRAERVAATRRAGRGGFGLAVPLSVDGADQPETAGRDRQLAHRVVAEATFAGSVSRGLPLVALGALLLQHQCDGVRHRGATDPAGAASGLRARQVALSRQALGLRVDRGHALDPGTGALRAGFLVAGWCWPRQHAERLDLALWRER